MSSITRSMVARLPRTFARPQTIRTYADKTSDNTGETMKQAGQAFKSDGAIGSKFQADGSIGSKAEQVGGPFSKDGAVGKHFTDSGAIGGNVEKAATDAKQSGQNVKDGK